jgi:ABC-type transport system substrate-binding protein
VAIDEMTTLFGQAFTTDEEAEYAAYEEMQELYYAQDPIGILARFNQTWAMSADIQDFTIHELLQPIWAMSSRTQ